MKVKSIKNISNEDVKLELDNTPGCILTLLPGRKFENIHVYNLDEIRDKVQVTSDLGEIVETSKNPTRLLD